MTPPPTRRVDLAIAMPRGGDIALGMTIAGRGEVLVMSRAAAASLVGRIAKALAEPIDPGTAA